MNTFTKNGHTFQVAEWGNFWESLERGEWEPHTFKVIDEFVTSDGIFLDVGAWIGPITLYASKLVHWCYSIEPDPVAFDVLQKNVKLNALENVSLFNEALMNYNGVVTLGNCGNLGDSGTRRNQSEKTFSVSCSTLKTFVEKHNIPPIQFMKMDVEGAEEVILENVDFFREQNPVLAMSVHQSYLDDPNKARKTFQVIRRMYRKCYDVYMRELKDDEWSGELVFID